MDEGSAELRADRRQRLRRILGAALALLLLAALVVYLARFSNEWQRLEKLEPSQLALLSAIVLLGHVALAGKLRRSVTLFGARLELWEAFCLIEFGSFVNLVPLNLGTPLRAAYLKRVASLDYLKFGLGFMGMQLSAIVVAGVVGLCFIVSTASPTNAAAWPLWVGFGAFVIAPCLAVAAGLWLRRSAVEVATQGAVATTRLRALLTALRAGTEEMLRRPTALASWLLFDSITNFVMGARFFLVASFLGYDTGFASAMVLQAATRASAVVSLVPAGTIGLREGLSGLAAGALGQAAISGVLIATVDRIVATTWIVLLGTGSSFILKRRLARLDADGAAA
ncbi:MAG: flippase-like domain-containing protein [Myxococcales bacterium]|nr:flippase-like domain-containing protein [Myxococcales bacterium]